MDYAELHLAGDSPLWAESKEEFVDFIHRMAMIGPIVIVLEPSGEGWLIKRTIEEEGGKDGDQKPDVPQLPEGY